MKLIMENWRRFLNEWGAYGNYGDKFMGRKIDQEKIGKAQQAMSDKVPAITSEDIRFFVSLVDPTQISAYPDIPPAIKAWEDNPSWGNSALLVLALMAAIPIVGKAAKGISKFSKSLKFVKGGRMKAKEIEDVLMVSLPPGSSVRKDIEDLRKVLDPNAPRPRSGGEHFGPFDWAKELESTRLSKGERRSSSFSGTGGDWYVPAKPLNSYKFIRVTNAPLRYYHGGSKGLTKGKVSTLNRPGGGGSLASSNQAGFYATTNKEAAGAFADGLIGPGKNGQIYTIDVSKNAKIYRIPDEMQREAGKEGLTFLNFDVASQKAMAKKGIDALYNPKTGDIIIINKKILKSVKPVKR